MKDASETIQTPRKKNSSLRRKIDGNTPSKSGRDRADKALRASERRIKRNLKNILFSDNDDSLKDLTLSDVLDVQVFQTIMDDFFMLTNISNAIIDVRGTVLVAAGWQDICTKFHRVNPETHKHCIESDTILTKKVNPGAFKLYRCRNNLWDMATPIFISGRHLGNIILGQMMLEDEPRDREIFRAQARRYGFNEQKYLAAFERVPVFSRETVSNAMAFCTNIAHIISTLSYSNIRLARTLTEQEQAERLLKEREELLNRVGDIAKIGGWEIDMTTGKVMWSKGTYDIIEIDYDQPPAGLNEQTGFYLPEYRDMVENSLKQLIETAQPVVVEAPVKSKKKGTIKWCQTVAEAVTENGKVVKLQGAVKDITERKKAEDEIRTLNAELEERVAARTAELAERTRQMEAFTYSVSHDLKAPLRGIDGYSRLLLEGYSDRLDEEGLAFLKTVRQATEQMRQLIEDLLDYSRMERRSLSSREVHPLSFIKTLIDERSEDIAARNIKITLTIPDVVVKSDPEGLIQVLRNLLDNAIKFTGRVPDPSIEIGGEERDTTCLFWVRDNGIGFDMRYHDRIFEIFHRLHSTDDYPGTGIGMAIVQKAIKRMGGRAWTESVPGKGATFYLEVPK